MSNSANRFRRLALLLGLLLCWALPAAAGTLRVEAMDVGQGDSILITTPAGKRVLIDGSIARADVLGKLRQRGVESLDLVVATHPHADHIGGLPDVLAALPVRVFTDNGLPHTTMVYGELMRVVEERGVPYRPAQAGQTFKLDDGIVIEVLHPGPTPLSNTRSDLNSNSVVLRLTHGDRCFLFTGDSEEPTEQELLRRGIEPCDVLKVAHHGSDHSTETPWLRAVQPEVALISCGVGNRYGHPGPETMARLEGAGVEVYRTDTMGDIVVESDGRKLTVTTSGKEAGAGALVSTLPGRRPGGARPAAVAPGRGDGWSLGDKGQSADEDQDMAPAAPARTGESKNGKAPPASKPNAALGTPGQPGCAFVSSRTSGLYHPADCHVVDRIWEGNRVCWESEAAAQAAGKQRSQACR